MPAADHDYSQRPSSARIYDALLGGSHNFEADRAAARRLLEALPEAGELARLNREFLRRSVRFMLDAGVRQFLDIGSGIPTVGNVHEITLEIAPEARVVYVDIDPVAVAHSREILAENPVATVVQADMRFPDDLLGRPEVTDFLDLTRPVGLLLVSVLHFLPDEDAFDAVTRLRAALPPGSYLAISHGLSDTPADAALGTVQSIYSRSDVATAAGRSRNQIHSFFGDGDLVEPGLVPLHDWPTPQPKTTQQSALLAGVARL